MKAYTLRGKRNNPDVRFSINDLIPIKSKKKFDFIQLCFLVNNDEYYTTAALDKAEYESLYSVVANQGCDFFRIKDTELIIIPGYAIFPTLINEDQLV
jgi:hypothetical protein